MKEGRSSHQFKAIPDILGRAVRLQRKWALVNLAHFPGGFRGSTRGVEILMFLKVVLLHTTVQQICDCKNQVFKKLDRLLVMEFECTLPSYPVPENRRPDK